MYANFEKLTDDEVEKVCKELLRQAFGVSINSNKLEVTEVQPRRLEYTYGRLFIVFAPSVFNDRVTVYPDKTGMCGMFCSVNPERVYDDAGVTDKFRERGIDMTAKELFLKGIHNVTRCARDKDGAALGCSKCPVITKTACTMELIAWDMARGGVIYG